MPGALLSGSKLSLQLEDIASAFVFYNCTAPAAPGGLPTGISAPIAVSDGLKYNISDMQVMLDAMTIWDSSQMMISAASSSLASSGLQYTYYNTYQTRYTLANGTTSATLDVLLAAAKLKHVILRFRPQAPLVTNGDSFASLPLVAPSGSDAIFGPALDSNVGKLGGGSIRLRIGSDLLSLLPVSNAGQAFRMTYQALCDTKNGLDSEVDPLHNKNKPVDLGVSYADWYTGSGCSTIAIDCEKSSNLSISGYATNNSRALQIELTGLQGVRSVLLDVFVVFLSCANVTNENVVIDK